MNGLDFVKISTRSVKRDTIEIFPKFVITRSSDLMVRGGDFYAVWIEERGMWSTDEQDVVRIIDRELDAYYEEHKDKFYNCSVAVRHMWDASSGAIDDWHRYVKGQMRDSYHMLDENLIFANTTTDKSNYASKALPYSLEEGDCPAWDTILSTLYSPEERHKIEWAIGSIVTGASKQLQKFLVFYGEAGTGKSTVLNIVQDLFEGYWVPFDAKALGSNGSEFALEAFKTNPLVAIQHDGDLSRIEDNARINSLVSHETMTVNEKFKATYANSFKAFLFMGTNRPVKITDAKSGILRRLIDVSPSGNKIPIGKYHKLMKDVKFELGSIATKCAHIFEADPYFYDDYQPISMMAASNDFFNFIEECEPLFSKNDSTTLKEAWAMWKEYCAESNVQYIGNQRTFKEELKNYFNEFHERHYVPGSERVRNYYCGFKMSKLEQHKNGGAKEQVKQEGWIVFKDEPDRSIFDRVCKDSPAQYANGNVPTKAWADVTTTLADLDTHKLHYVKVPENIVTVDFDIPDEEGNKCLAKNLEEANKWPPTYAELSKSGQGIHLEYIYKGDTSKLSRIYGDHIEIKVQVGNASLRRALTKCNDLPIATITSGLPLKEVKKVIDTKQVMNEKELISFITKIMKKEVPNVPGTASGVALIKKTLEEAYNSGIAYDVTSLKGSIISFAMGSTNQSSECLKMVADMKFKSEDPSESIDLNDRPIAFFDIEVFPNLFLINYKAEGEGKQVVRLINPSPKDIETMMYYRLVGFNCRRYDNHVVYAALMGYSNEQLYKLSKRIIGGDKNAFFSDAYNLSYTDIYDYAAKKQSLKKWEIELNIHHEELGLDWDSPVPEELWEKVARYCDNDVVSTEAVWNHTTGDFKARQILAKLAGMSVNSTTNSLTTKIIFGNEKKPKLHYTHLEETFPGYSFERLEDGKWHNLYRGTDMGFGGYIKSWPGLYSNAALLDVESLHPTSAIEMSYFGEYTSRFKDIKDARVLIKHKNFEAAKTMLNGALAEFLDDESVAADLCQALKIAINSVYGLTSANFDNPFTMPENKNNIVALRGALFMRTLEDEVAKRGFNIIAIKTDSIKIADANADIIEFCIDFAKQYGYKFEFEAFYDRICQINDADYIARYKSSDYCRYTFGCVPGDNAKHERQWTATGKKFAIPYTHKKLFTKEPITMDDLGVTFETKSALYLDMNYSLPDVSLLEKERDKMVKKGIYDGSLDEEIANGHSYIFIGKVGRFTPITEGGGIMYMKKDDKYNATAGSKGYRWMETEMLVNLNKLDLIDYSYFNAQANDAAESIIAYGDIERFLADEEYAPCEYKDFGGIRIPTYSLELPLIKGGKGND